MYSMCLLMFMAFNFFPKFIFLVKGKKEHRIRKIISHLIPGDYIPIITITIWRTIQFKPNNSNEMNKEFYWRHILLPFIRNGNYSNIWMKCCFEIQDLCVPFEFAKYRHSHCYFKNCWRDISNVTLSKCNKNG